MAVTAIKAKELHDKMESGQSVLILDVRNSEDFNDWKIENKHIESINIPYFDFLDEDEATFNQIPKDAYVVVICAKGGSAQMVAEMLDERGYNVTFLEGGMKEWSQFYHPVTVVKEDDFELIQVNRLAKGCLSYMMVSEGKALIVDPGRHVDEYVKLANEKNATIEHIVDTHLHADHISGAFDLAKQTGAKYYITSSEMQGSTLPYEPLEENKHLKIGKAEIKVIAVPTPGHTPGSASILVNDQYLLSGDTIFVGGLGRPDLGGKAREWAQSLYETVFSTVSALSDDVIVLPSHFADISEFTEGGYVGALLGEIRAANEIMRTEDREQFTEMVASNVGATPPNFEDIVQINRGSITVDAEKATELEIGPNRCAIHHS